MSIKVLIAGGGMVGGTLACALARGGIHVTVVEAHEPKPFVVDGDYDLRVSAVSAGAEMIFRNLEVWPLIQQRRSYAFRNMMVWDAESQGHIHFDALDIGEPRLGHIIENSAIQDALIERLRGMDTATWHCPDAITEIEVAADRVIVTLESGAQFEPHLIVGADGANSKVRSLVGIDFRTHAYEQRAVVANVCTEQPVQRTAWQRFLPTGPLALLPLSDNQGAVVWSTTAQHAETLVDLADGLFCDQLAEAFDFRLGNVVSTSARASFPLRGGQAEPYVCFRVALVGDAAHTIHPLAGQGANLGFMDAATLAEVLMTTHRDIGSLRVLRRYERARKADNVLMMRVMEGFRILFGTTSFPVVWLRSMGLSLTDALGPLKHVIMRHAMDLAGERPQLARGPLR